MGRLETAEIYALPRAEGLREINEAENGKAGLDGGVAV